jgi:putative NIF3 family GTP cyclohydrolase 1 type 2
MKIQDVIDYVFEIAPDPPHAWENVYLYGDGLAEVSGITVAWWITPEMLTDMAERGCNLGLSHERIRFELPARFVWGTLPPEDEIPVNREIQELTGRHGITVHQFHSNIDKVSWGMPHALLDRLGWQDYPADWSRGVPVVELPPRSLGSLIAELKETLALPFVRYDGDPDRVVSRVAIPWGGLCQGYGGVICALPLGFDVVVGGDIIDGVVRLARAHGWAVIDAMHHATEIDAMQVLTEKVRARFPQVPVTFVDNTAPWRVM